jgi:hypothetical protein
MPGRRYIVTVLFSIMPGILFLSPEKDVCQKLLSFSDRTKQTRPTTMLFENALPDCHKVTAFSIPSECREVLHKNTHKFSS